MNIIERLNAKWKIILALEKEYGEKDAEVKTRTFVVRTIYTRYDDSDEFVKVELYVKANDKRNYVNAEALEISALEKIYNEVMDVIKNGTEEDNQ